jgi:hypothetical protein
MHYTRLSRTGSIEGIYPQGDPFDRLMRKINKNDSSGCWVYIGKTTKNGYSVVGDGRYGWHYGHRLVYERLIGPIGNKKRLHHICENPLCVNPNHLKPLTVKEHSNHHGLGVGPCRKCSGNDWYLRPDNGTRQCRICRNNRRRSHNTK